MIFSNVIDQKGEKDEKDKISFRNYADNVIGIEHRFDGDNDLC